MPSEGLVEPVWPTLDLLVHINAVETSATGEPHALLSMGLLESAWARPRNRWAYEDETDVVALAVSLMAGLAQNHAFQQGNKRTAFLAGVSLLELNGFTLSEDIDSSALADAFVQLIEHTVDEAAFAGRLRPHVVPLD